MQSRGLGDIPQEDQGSCPLLLSNRRSLLACCQWNDYSSRAASQGYVRDMPQHVYIQPGEGGCISDMSICRKMQNRVNLGLKRRIFMPKTHMFLCFYVVGNAPISHPRYVIVTFHSTLNSLPSILTISYPHMSQYHLPTID